MFPILPLILILFSLRIGQPPTPQKQDPPTSIPKIARIAGIRVGANSIEEMEERLGKGHHSTGGHPGGMRTWQIRRTRWYLSADGFDYDHRGRIVDSMWISSGGISDKNDPVPATKRTKRSLDWLGIVRPGMSKAQVLQAIKGKVEAPKMTETTWTWEAKGFTRLQDDVFHTWKASIQFDRGQVAVISVRCE